MFENNGFAFDSAGSFFGESTTLSFENGFSNAGPSDGFFSESAFDENGFSTSETSVFGESVSYGGGFTQFGSAFSESAFDEDGFSTDGSDFFTETSSDIFTETKVPVRRIDNSSKSSSSKKDTDNSEKYHTNYEPNPQDHAKFASSAKKSFRNVEEKTTTGMLHKSARDERTRAKADDRTAEDYDIEAVRSPNPIDSETYRDLADNARESAARRRQYADSLTKIAKNHSARVMSNLPEYKRDPNKHIPDMKEHKNK